MIIPILSPSVLVRVLATNGMSNVKFGEQTQLKGMKIKGMVRVNTGADDIDTSNTQEKYVTLKIGATLHFDKFPTSFLKKESTDTYSLVSERPVNWADSYIEWATPLTGVPTEGKYITFLVFYEPAK